MLHRASTTRGAGAAGGAGATTPVKAKAPGRPGGKGKGRPKAALRRQEAPCASEAPYPPAAWRCSTFGDGGLNCRVRNGIG